MARIETDPNYNAPTFSRATAPTDIFKKEDVQNVAAAFSTHTHDGSGKGLAVAFTGVPPGSIPGTALADGAVTSVKIADGTIATVDIANAAVTNAKLASDTDRTNLLTNGGFEIWQRGNGPFAPAALYGPDRWYIAPMHAGETIARDTANADNSAACAVVVTNGSSTVGSPCQIWNQKILENQQIRGKTFSFSVRVRTTIPNAVRLVIYDGATPTYGAYHPGDNTYRTLSVTGTPNGTTFDVAVNIEAAGTTYLDNAMLVVGSQYADYVPMHPADDLARCLRYYEVISAGVNAYLANGQAYTTTQAVFVVPYLPKPVAPTVTLSAASTFAMAGVAFGLNTCTTMTNPSLTNRGAGISGTAASGLIAGNASTLLGAGARGHSYV